MSKLQNVGEKKNELSSFFLNYTVLEHFLSSQNTLNFHV